MSDATSVDQRVAAVRAAKKVYFVEALGTGCVKVGTAFDVNRRLSDIQQTTPHELRLRRIEDGGYTREHYLHARWSQHHVRGEWFRLVDEVASYIETGELDPANHTTADVTTTVDPTDPRVVAMRKRSAHRRRQIARGIGVDHHGGPPRMMGQRL